MFRLWPIDRPRPPHRDGAIFFWESSHQFDEICLPWLIIGYCQRYVVTRVLFVSLLKHFHILRSKVTRGDDSLLKSTRRRLRNCLTRRASIKCHVYTSFTTLLKRRRGMTEIAHETRRKYARRRKKKKTSFP